MKKLLTALTLSALLLSACSVDVNTDPEAEVSPTETTETTGTSNLSDAEEELLGDLLEGDPLEECDVEWEKNWVEEDAGFITEQMTGCYEVFGISLTLISAPNQNWAGIETRAWEAEGNTAWAGILIRKTAGDHEVFFKIPDEGFNPVGLYQTEDSLILDTVAGDGAGSGEGTLQRYVYTFAGVSEEILNTWQKEKCTSYYVPETYNWETASCE